MFNRLRYTAKAGALMTVLATGVLVAGASPALADTSAATANAATLSLGGATLLTTGTCTVSNAGPPAPADVCTQTPALGLLGTQSGIQAGVLAQLATANPDGTSAACAGLVGAGGTIQIGAGGACTFQSLPSGGVVIDAGGLAVIRADAVLAECTASSTGAGTTKVTLVNATIQLLGALTPVPLDSFPAANTPVLNLGALLALTLNVQPPATTPPPPAGSVGATALDLSVLGGLLGAPPLVHLTVGTVTCGPNAVSPVGPIFPVKGLPIALATLIGVGAVAVIVRRHRGAATNV